MSRVALVAALAIAAVPLSAQANPFKVAKPGLKTLAVTYSLTGDIAGTATVAMDGDRMVRRQTSTMKMMGKTSSSDSWTLVTPDSSYMADLTKKQGTVMPNMLPIMARAYDGLDGDAKKRMHQNMQDMSSMLSRAFGLSSINSGEKIGTKTYAGQECEEKKFGSFSVCTMTKAPVMLHSQGSLVCMNFEETATAVSLGAPPADAFTPPAGITFTPDPHLQQPDSMARAFVGYLSSQQLSDSLAKAKQELAAAQAKSGGDPAKMTPEQQASFQQACDAMKNFDMGTVMAGAGDAMKKAMADAAKNAAKDAASSKLKGLFHKPKIPQG